MSNGCRYLAGTHRYICGKTCQYLYPWVPIPADTDSGRCEYGQMAWKLATHNTCTKHLQVFYLWEWVLVDVGDPQIHLYSALLCRVCSSWFYNWTPLIFEIGTFIIHTNPNVVKCCEFMSRILWYKIFQKLEWNFHA
jgi:hypothetical protein